VSNAETSMCINKIFLMLIIYGVGILLFFLIKNLSTPIESLDITKSPKSIVKFDLNKNVIDVLNNENFKIVTQEDLKKIALHNKNYKAIIECGNLYLVNKRNNKKISICCFSEFKDNTLFNDIYINDKWIVDVAMDNKYFTVQLLFFDIKRKYQTFDGDYLLKINVDSFKLKGNILFMHSNGKWIKLDLNTKEIIK
jgi:hypothetical protein